MAGAGGRWTCYVLSFTTQAGKHREYHGMTELLGPQSAEDACEVRLRNHKKRPVECLEFAVVSTLEIHPVGSVLTAVKNCRAQEAINTVRALEADSSARGACWSCKRIGGFLSNAAAQVRKAIKGLDGQAARQAVQQYASTLDSAHPLQRHLAGLSYRDVPRSDVPLPKTKKSSGGRGKPGNQTRRRQLAMKEYARNSDKHKRLHYGTDPDSKRQEETKREATKRAAARKRPASASGQ